MTAVLSLEDVHVALRDRGGPAPILRGVSLSIASGEVHGLVGESGAGKSMIARSVFGLLPGGVRITAGRVLFEGTDLTGMAERTRRGLLGSKITLIPQDPTTSLNPVKRIGEQIGAVLRRKLGMRSRAASERTLVLLADVAIRDPERVARLYPHELSGGMRQRILIATAFAGTPRLVVADEPTTALDVTVQRQILKLIRDLQSRHGSAVLFVTHDIALVAKVCQSVSVLYAGRVLERGSTVEVLARPQHPYTQALLAATPRLDRPAEALQPMPHALTEGLLGEARAYDRSHAAAYR